MEKNSEILSEITIFNKYSKYIHELARRETWNELVDRTVAIHVKKFPQHEQLINTVFDKYVRTKKVLPSMRLLQFAGKPIEINPSRIYNCAYLPVEHYLAFPETMMLLLGGTGVGYSVRKHHIDKLPMVVGPKKDKRKRYLIGDSIEGWSDAVRALVKSYFEGGRTIEFDYSDIREKGMPLITSGGKAPGPGPLEECLVKIKYKLEDVVGRKITDIEVHDIQCYIADAVLAGGIRRAAMISLFSPDSMEMRSCKSGDWYEKNPQRARANNSAVLNRSEITEKQFREILNQTKLSGAGEPGIFLSNTNEGGTNPCAEVALEPYQFCNLVEVNVSDIHGQWELEDRMRAASRIATFQATYTNFHYLRPMWEDTTKKDALIGVSMTGIASGKLDGLDLARAAEVVKMENGFMSRELGINPAARTTCVKPAGSTSLVLGTSSGIHAWHSKYYLRRLRILKSDPLYDYLNIHHSHLLEDDMSRPHDTAIISIPIKAPDGAITREESPIQLLERIKRIYTEWIVPGHERGADTNNVSATVNVKPHEWNEVIDWMWENRNSYNGISLFPYDNGTYVQAPHEDITKEQYEELSRNITSIDLTEVLEYTDETNLTQQLACAGGLCEIT